MQQHPEELRLRRFRRAVFQRAWLGDEVCKVERLWAERAERPAELVAACRLLCERVLVQLCEQHHLPHDHSAPLPALVQELRRGVERARLTSDPTAAVEAIQRAAGQGGRPSEAELRLLLEKLCAVLEWAQELAPLKLLEPERSPLPFAASSLLLGVAAGFGLALLLGAALGLGRWLDEPQPLALPEPAPACEPSAPSPAPKPPELLPLASSSAQPPASPARPMAAPRVRVKAGPAWRGHDDGDERHRPRHQLDLPSFDLDAQEVTVARYRACVQEKKCKPPAKSGGLCNWERPGAEQHPINCVSWAQARNFCLAQGGRLPTEAEWEKAARGEVGQTYPWGEAAPAPGLAVFGQRAQGTLPVGGRPQGASPFGAQDMAGNVWEWVEDVFHEAAYREATEAERRCWRCGEKGGTRVYRGGSFGSDPAKLQAWLRKGMQGGEADEGIGVRCAYDDDEVGGAAPP